MLAGVDFIDTAHGPMAGASAQPPVELMRFVAEHLGHEHNLDTHHLPRIDAELRRIRKELSDADKDAEHMGGPWPDEPDRTMRKRIEQACELIATEQRDACDRAIAILEDQIMVDQGYPPVDRAQLESQIPGGMLSNLHKQLKDQDKLDLLPEILKEVPRVRADAGYPPLVTPSSQIVGTQASFNVATGQRYSMMSNEFRNLVTGKYGRPPGKVSPEVLNAAAPDGGTYDRRPADYVEDVDLEQVYREHGELIRSHRDLLLLLLFPGPAKTFLGQRPSGVEES
jgi:pyruvate/oxaloacetate carboxyltransferase